MFGLMTRRRHTRLEDIEYDNKALLSEVHELRQQIADHDEFIRELQADSFQLHQSAGVLEGSIADMRTRLGEAANALSGANARETRL